MDESVREILAGLIGIPREGEYLEIRLERELANRIGFQDGDLRRLREDRALGGSVRVLHPKSGWSFFSFNGWSDLEEKVREVLRGAAMLPDVDNGIVRGEGLQGSFPAEMKKDFREIPIREKIALLARYAHILNSSHEEVVNSSVEYRDIFRESYVATTEGAMVYREIPDIQLHLSAVARGGEDIEVAFDGAAGKAGFEVVEGLDEMAAQVGERSVQLLEAPSVEGGVYDCILDPILAGVFIHEAFGHLSESDFLYRNKNLREIMALGKRVAAPLLNVVDDGTEANLRGSSPCDDEGTPGKRTFLIQEGIISGRLHSRETAFLMNEEVTGNARALSCRYAPIVRMTNTGILPGFSSQEDLFRDIEKGIYAVRYLGGNTALELFTFSAAYGYVIEKGKMGGMIKNIILSGNLFETLGRIDGIADDFYWNQLGGCGKGEQAGLPTSTGSPHVRLREVLIGGQHSG